MFHYAPACFLGDGDEGVGIDVLGHKSLLFLKL